MQLLPAIKEQYAAILPDVIEEEEERESVIDSKGEEYLTDVSQ